MPAVLADHRQAYQRIRERARLHVLCAEKR